jgi:SpoVK/Ycf46/Vps4 family AAA+-type ATPase
VNGLTYEAARMAQLYGHDTVDREHVLAAILKMNPRLEFAGSAVARVTIKRILFELVDTGLVNRSIGGAITQTSEATSWIQRYEETNDKRVIAHMLCQQVLPYHGYPFEPVDQPPRLAEPEPIRKITAAEVSPPRLATPLKPLDEAIGKIDRLIGLGEVKEHVHNMVTTVKFAAKVAAAGAEIPFGLHLAFLGDPGTGKTTVAKLYAEIYKELGLLSNGQTVEVTRADLVAKYVGQTAPMVRAAVDRAMGGVLFIDEAHSLFSSSGHDFGHEALSELVKLMEERRGQFALILAGYTSEMTRLLGSDPGLNSRINKKVLFANYSAEELLGILKSICADSKLVLSEGACQAVLKHLQRTDTAGQNGNGRYARTLFEKMCERLAQRVMAGSERSIEQLTTFEADDVPGFVGERPTPISLEESLAKLDALTGLAEVKAKVRALVNLLRANAAMELAGKRPVPATLDLAFTGDPGTGKTTVALIVSQIYQALGILSSGHLVTANRASLVGEYIGQTAPKVKAKIDESMGGVLFIDEAYALSPSGSKDFGNEAIATLIDSMEAKRGQFAVIVAGYENEMNKFLDTNPGMRSRIEVVHFPNYSKEDLVKIFVDISKPSGVKLSDEFMLALRNYLNQVETSGAAGNARFARTLFENTFSNAVTRAAEAAGTSGDIDLSLLTNLLPSDLPPIPPRLAPEDEGPRRIIGFRPDSH